MSAATGPAGRPAVVVRWCAPQDVELITATEAPGRRYAESTFRRQEAGLCVYLVAWAGFEPVGSGELEAGSRPELKNLHVLPSHRGRGVGTAIIRSAEHEAAPAGALRIGVDEDNPAARRVYVRLGYHPPGESATYTYDFIDDDGTPGNATETSHYLQRTLPRPD